MHSLHDIFHVFEYYKLDRSVIYGDEVVVWKADDQAAAEFGFCLCEATDNSLLCANEELLCKGLFVLEFALLQ